MSWVWKKKPYMLLIFYTLKQNFNNCNYLSSSEYPGEYIKNNISFMMV